MDTVRVQVVDTVQVVNNYMQSGDMDISTLMIIIIAGAAFFVSIWQVYATRRHNRLSVTPKITFLLSRLRGDLGISIQNKGVGPAIIEEFSIGVKDQYLYPFPSEEAYDKIFSVLGLDTLISPTIETINVGDFIESGNSFFIIEFDDSKTYSDETLQNVVEALMKINIEIKWRSIYKEKFRKIFE